MADLSELYLEGFALAADCTPAQAKDWLRREAEARKVYGDFADLIADDAMATYRRTGMCPTCGGDAVTHEPLEW